MRVLGSEAVQDPTKVEAHVRAQMAERQKYTHTHTHTYTHTHTHTSELYCILSSGNMKRLT